MKRIKWMSLLIALLCCFLFPLAACGNDDEGKLEPTDPSKILVAYFSATGTTKGVAEKIAEVTGGELYEIVPAVPYTAADLNYNSDSSRTSAEDEDSSARPQIEGEIADMGSFDVVYLGYPIWFGKAPKIIYTFLESYDFSGKTIVPFCTSGSSKIGSSAENLHALAGGANWLSGERFSSSASKSEVEEWINSLIG